MRIFKLIFPKILFVLGIILLTFPLIVYAQSKADSLGMAGIEINKLISQSEFLRPIADVLTIALVAVLYRAVQVFLTYKRKAKWKWLGNKLVMSTIDRILTKFFGKSIAYYNMQIIVDKPEDKEKAKEEAKKLAYEHIKEHRGEMLKAFEDALK